MMEEKRKTKFVIESLYISKCCILHPKNFELTNIESDTSNDEIQISLPEDVLSFFVRKPAETHTSTYQFNFTIRYGDCNGKGVLSKTDSGWKLIGKFENIRLQSLLKKLYSNEKNKIKITNTKNEKLFLLYVYSPDSKLKYKTQKPKINKTNKKRNKKRKGLGNTPHVTIGVPKHENLDKIIW